MQLSGKEKIIKIYQESIHPLKDFLFHFTPKHFLRLSQCDKICNFDDAIVIQSGLTSVLTHPKVTSYFGDTISFGAIDMLTHPKVHKTGEGQSDQV